MVELNNSFNKKQRASDLGNFDYDLPANTLSADNDIASITAWGTKTGTAAAMDVFPMLQDSLLETHTLAAAGASFLTRSIVVRTAAGAQKSVSFMHGNSDASGSTNLVNVTTLAQDETADLGMAVLMTPGSTDTASREGQIVAFRC